MPTVIKPHSAKVTKKQLICSQYSQMLLAYYSLLLLDLVVIWTKWLSPNLRAIVIFQLSFILAVSVLPHDYFDLINRSYQDSRAQTSMLMTSTLFLFGSNLALYHLLIA